MPRVRLPALRGGGVRGGPRARAPPPPPATPHPPPHPILCPPPRSHRPRTPHNPHHQHARKAERLAGEALAAGRPSEQAGVRLSIRNPCPSLAIRNSFAGLAGIGRPASRPSRHRPRPLRVRHVLARPRAGGGSPRPASIQRVLYILTRSHRGHPFLPSTSTSARHAPQVRRGGGGEGGGGGQRCSDRGGDKPAHTQRRAPRALCSRAIPLRQRSHSRHMRALGEVEAVSVCS